jgi:cyclopropane fatty-acyl-phospholipid synthase-like methyltransferase
VLANVLHHFAPEQILALLARVHQALSPGGTVVIWEIERRQADAAPELLSDISSLIFRLTSASRCFSAGEYRTWLTDTGFVAARAARAMAAPIHALIHARKRG